MSKTILFEEKLEKINDDKYYFHRNFTAELTKDEVLKNIDSLKNNTETLKKMIEGINIEEDLKREEKKFDTDVKIKQEALKDYDKYFSENLIKLKNNKTKDKLQIKAFLDRADEVKKMILDKRKKALLNMKETYEIQLDDELKSLEVYNEFNK